jgi:hypothetical protein
MKAPTVSWGVTVLPEEMLIKKVAEGTVSHVVQQTSHPEQRLDVTLTGNVRTDVPQAAVERSRGPTAQMHGPQNVLESRMFRRGIDPPRGLQLVDLPHSLDPRMVDDGPLRHTTRTHSAVRRERDVTVNWIVSQCF